MDNIISQLKSIEEEADLILRNARKQAAQTKSLTSERVETVRKRLESEFQAACSSKREEVNKKTEAVLSEILSGLKHQKDLLQSINEEKLTELVCFITGKVRNGV